MEDDPKKKRRKAPEASVGGKARAQALSSAERRMIASEAAKARWSTAKATHFGEGAALLVRADLAIRCVAPP